MTRWFYIAVIAALFVLMAVAPVLETPDRASIAERIATATGAPNSVAGVLLWNRLYDTAFEVLVFTLAVLGAHYAFSFQPKQEAIRGLTDPTMIILCRAGAMVSALIFLELAVRGHLAPGGGFAAGVAGGTALSLVTLTGDASLLHDRHHRWRLGGIEKVIVLIILAVSIVLFALSASNGAPTAVAGITIPALNMLIGLKVAIGSWTITLLFVRHRGVL